LAIDAGGEVMIEPHAQNMDSSSPDRYSMMNSVNSRRSLGYSRRAEQAWASEMRRNTKDSHGMLVMGGQAAPVGLRCLPGAVVSRLDCNRPARRVI
jgi:hypothetical protein